MVGQNHKKEKSLPKIVDKEERRREIALSCQDLIHEVGIKKLTISQVAKTAGIGKGTVYEYFSNKEDIIFEIINIHIEQYHNEFVKTIQNVKSTKEKVLHFFNFAIDDSELNTKHLNGYKEYLSITLLEDNDSMKEFNKKCSSFFKEQLIEMFKEGIQKKELDTSVMDIVDGLMAFEKGLVVLRMTQKDYDAKKVCESFLDSIFEKIEIKEK